MNWCQKHGHSYTNFCVDCMAQEVSKPDSMIQGKSYLEQLGDEFNKKLLENGFGKPPANDADAAMIGHVLNVAGEAGEFVEAWRRYAGLARRKGSSAEALEELADVVIAAYVCASMAGWPLDQAIQGKAHRIRTRGWREQETQKLAEDFKKLATGNQNSAAAYGLFQAGKPVTHYQVSSERLELEKPVLPDLTPMIRDTMGYLFNRYTDTDMDKMPNILSEDECRIYKASPNGTGYWIEITKDLFVYCWDRDRALSLYKHRTRKGQKIGCHWNKLPGLGSLNLVHNREERLKVTTPKALKQLERDKESANEDSA